MTAALVNLDDGKPSDIEGWNVVGDFLPSMSTLVRQIRREGLTTFDTLAEHRVWGSSARTVRAVEHPLEDWDRYTITVAYVGENSRHHSEWDRVIWTNVEPDHNVGRVFVGREELEDA